MMNTNDAAVTPDPTTSAPALVLERWNSWVRVFLPATSEVRWVNLQESGYEPMDQGPELESVEP